MAYEQFKQKNESSGFFLKFRLHYDVWMMCLQFVLKSLVYDCMMFIGSVRVSFYAMFPVRILPLCCPDFAYTP